MVVIQDQVMATKNYRRVIMREAMPNDMCRRCGTAPETIQHITSACPTMAGNEYTRRHDSVANIVHHSLALQYGLIPEKVPYYKYQPSPVLENDAVSLYWDRSLLTDHPIVHNRPDIVLRAKGPRITYLIDVGIPNSHNLQQYYTEKISKYLPLGRELQQIWRQDKVEVLPIILSSTAIVLKSTTENIRILNIKKWEQQQMVKAVVLGTCSIVRGFFNI